ncbi:metal-dependent hydrolase [Halalkalibacillus halophilus]|uniref:metal-dependent hydrolase n=1 Tax=Halalkalibacillus halophilus TaxID=392827 RepID=UPI000428B6B8|nr:metal-dependent hydrolase [Halalkalibacillus halophilus]
MKVSYHGHSVVKVQNEGKTILIDPFISGNELCDLKVEDQKPDVILLTHGHNDHVGDTVQIAKANDALVVAPFELANYMGSKGLNAHPMHIGGKHEFDFGTVKFTQAFHGSSFEEEDGTIVYTGMPAGILLTIAGKTIYHVGDTGLFSDLKLIGDLNDIDLAFVPIGDNFTMGPEDAKLAVDWIQAKQVVPVHYDTFPVIKQDPEKFVNSLSSSVGKVMSPGDELNL